MRQIHSFWICLIVGKEPEGQYLNIAGEVLNMKQPEKEIIGGQAIFSRVDADRNCPTMIGMKRIDLYIGFYPKPERRSLCVSAQWFLGS